MAYGYGVSLTPLQTLTFYNAIANQGEMVQPRFLTEIGNLGNTPFKVFSKQVLNPSICSEETLKKVQSMMFNVVDKSGAQVIELRILFFPWRENRNLSGGLYQG